MAIDFFGSIDLHGNELRNSLAHLLGTDPVSPVEGQFWYDTANHKLKYRTNSATVIVYPSASANTSSTNVLRDSSGDFTAHDITANDVIITGSSTSSSSVATIGYVNSVAQGLEPKPSVTCATTTTLPSYTYSNGSSGVGATITFSSTGAVTIDGHALALNDYVLVKDETGGNLPYNGPYKVTTAPAIGVAGVMTRSVYADASADFDGAYMLVEQGTVNAKTGWIYQGATSPTIGTTDITFSQFTGAGDLTFNAPLSASGNTVSLSYTARLTNNGGSLDLASGIVTAGTYQSLTVDTYGRVTAGADIVSGNGIVTRTSSGNYTARTITGTSNKIDVTNGDGVSGAPTLTISATYVGQSSITTLGTITSGVWTGTSIAVANGGTGSGTAAGARSNLNAVGRYSALIGDNSSTSITITAATHGLAANSQNYAQITDASTGAVVYTDTTIDPSTGNVTFVFSAAPATNAYRATIIG